MAVSARYTAILDACVLYPRLLRDVLLSLSAVWKDTTQSEGSLVFYVDPRSIESIIKNDHIHRIVRFNRIKQSLDGGRWRLEIDKLSPLRRRH